MDVSHQQQYPSITKPQNYSQPGPSRLGHQYQPIPLYLESLCARATPLAPAPPSHTVEPFHPVPVDHFNMTGGVVSPVVANHPWPSARYSRPATVPPLPPVAPATIHSSSSSSSRFNQLLRSKLAAEQREQASVPQAVTVPSEFDASLAKLQRADILATASFADLAQNVDIKPDLATLVAAVPPCIPPTAQENYPQSPVQDCKLSSGSMPVPPVADMYPAPPVTNSSLQVPEGPRFWSAPSTPNAAGSSLSTPYEQAALVKYGIIPSPAPATASTPVTPVSNKYGNSESEWPQETGQPIQPTYVYKFSPVFRGQVSASSTPSLASSVESQAVMSPTTPMMSNYAPPAPIDIEVKPVTSPLLPAASLHSDDLQYGHGVYPIHAGIHDQPRFNTMSADGQGSLPSGNGIYDSGSGGDGLGGGGLDESNIPNGLDFSYGGSGDGNGGNGEGGSGGDQPPNPTKPKKLPLACHFCRRRKLKCDGTKPSCDNCNKRGVECSYDEAPRRRGPGKRTKEMRDRAAREAEAAGMINNNSVPPGEVDPSQHHQGQHQQLDVGDQHHHHHDDLILDPALADESGSGAFTDAMGALKRAGIDIGSLDDGDLGEPSTLAEISELHAAAASAEAEAAADESAVVERIKRKAETEIENSKRLRLDGAEGTEEQGGDETPVIPELDNVQARQGEE